MLTGYTKPTSLSWSAVKLSEKCSCIFLDLHTGTCSMWHYIFCVWSGCKAGNHTEQVLATTSCKIVEALCIEIVFTNTVHHQGRTLASARDFPSPSFIVVPASFEYMYFMQLLPPSIDNRGGGRNHVKSILSKFFGFNSYSVSNFLPAT